MYKKQENELITVKTYIDKATGEEIDVPVVNKVVKNKNFDMIFYGHLLDAIEELGNAKIKVVKEMVGNRTRKENAYLGNIAFLAKQSRVTYATAHKVVKLLKEKNFCRIKGGVIYINPNIICDGRFKNKIMLNYVSDQLTLDIPDE